MAQKLFEILLAILIGLVVRWTVSLNPYSGQGKSPMFGDYEAQRHWMEITYNLPVEDWYTNTSHNDLLYWGLDYPPLTAYHSWICGFVANKMNSSWVKLFESRGIESPEHKLFMRYSVLLMDILVYIPAVLCYYLWSVKGKGRPEKLFLAIIMLMYPGLLLIDHGHFQYNNASLGFTLWAVVAIASGHDLLGSIMFVLALNYKQMELYHSVPFFCYLLGSCFRTDKENGFLKLIKIGIVVLLTFALCWLPFLSSKDLVLQVLQRQFPFGRGLFEDKVSNIWCSLDVVIKLKIFLTQDKLLFLTISTTVLSLLPSAIDLLIRPTVQRFKYALINCSLVFFLFSYQVHEKSILIPALSVCLIFHQEPLLASWFLLISTFSMLPLLIKDGLLMPYIALCLLYIFLVAAYQRCFTSNSKNKQGLSHTFFHILGFLSVLGAAAISAITIFVKPPSRYPDLFPVLISGFSCIHFLFFLICFHILQFTSDDDSKEAKKNYAEKKLPGQKSEIRSGKRNRNNRKKKSKKD